MVNTINDFNKCRLQQKEAEVAGHELVDYIKKEWNQIERMDTG